MRVPVSSVSTPPRPTRRATVPPPRSRRLARWAVKAAASEVSRVRASLRRTLAAWGVSSERAEVLLLVATELLSNAVRHAGGPAGRTCLTVALCGGRLRLDVADGDPRLPSFAQDAGADVAPDAGPGADLGVDAAAEGGRGLAIVRFLVDEAGGRLAAIRVSTGKVVRIRMPIT
ncbi:ATP-binding protein [Streptomyces sp. NPDC048604]|uniref:ATP-binding protein n=1 Tax=Streptomyces sp. NPDC048604 TaxID=3365578 RepID=UPI003713AF89